MNHFSHAENQGQDADRFQFSVELAKLELNPRLYLCEILIESLSHTPWKGMRVLHTLCEKEKIEKKNLAFES